ncbi:hypothetical protein Acsp03_25940 [Actinomadura sp. NBRC 104412]|uniref:hypothetical protein n=1 Tax=Actinomadura sp. NBRC 104412 TaxID=3032203 RepID=UPI00249F9877|nr:hypothetical protein [Actinomadura sp. NBRC 104412]GLZ05128.1 hypothetical protein Acsp03_25940 [Actinomadura sp. NBRC 104412]
MTASDDIAELERAAQRLLDGRVAAIRELAVAKQARDRLRAELDEAERRYGTLYAEAERAGWQESELRELDFPDPERRPRGRPRQSSPRRKKSTGGTPPRNAPAAQPEPPADQAPPPNGQPHDPQPWTPHHPN